MYDHQGANLLSFTHDVLNDMAGGDEEPVIGNVEPRSYKFPFSGLIVRQQWERVADWIWEWACFTNAPEIP